MTDDIRAAAERVRRYESGDTGAYPERVGPPPWSPHSYGADVRVLMLAYLAEHPADEVEVITSDWLYSIGFRRLPHASWIHAISDSDEGPQVEMHPPSPPERPDEAWVVRDHEGDGSILPTPATRGQLRNILKVFGIKGG